MKQVKQIDRTLSSKFSLGLHADLLGTFSGKVNAQIKAILKAGLLMETEAVRTIRSERGFIDLYGMEMITMLSFHIATPQAKNLRRWIIGRLSENKFLLHP